MNKHRNIPTTIDNFRFASKREAARYIELKMLMRAKKIHSLVLQPSYPIIVNGVHVATYFADFKYIEIETGKEVTEDAKGRRLPIYSLKKKLVEALYPIKIVEV